MDEFEGRVAVITGAASGIGLAYAFLLGGLGMHLVLADIESAALERAAGSMSDRAPSIETVVTDVSDADSMQGLADRCFSTYDTVHLLCNNAGVSATRSLLDASLDDWKWMLGVNVWGLIHGIRCFVPEMVRRGAEGHVVNTCSIASWTVMPGYGMYSATKHAGAAISEALDRDLSEVGAPIGVTAVCPSLVRTQLFSSERNRPEILGGGPTVSHAEQERVDAITDGIQTPADVADAMLAGVTSNQLWVFPNRERLGAVRERFAKVLTSD